MNRMRLLFGISLLGLAAICAGQGAAAPGDGKIKITLSPETVVEQSLVTLGLACRIEGPDDLLEQVRAIGLGTFVSKGQVVFVDRCTILSRLASIGISADKIEFIGSEITSVKRKETVVEPERIVQAAREFLDRKLIGTPVSSLALIRTPSRIVLEDPNAVVNLSCQMSRYQTAGSLKVTVAVQQQGLTVSQVEVAFAVRYKVRQLVASQTIEAGTAITSENVQIQEAESSVPQGQGWKEPYGLVVRRKIAQGGVIHPDWLAPQQAPVLIRRNQQVLVQINSGALFVSAPGQALDEGKIGDLIRVRRGEKSEERIIYCTIQADGTVRPHI